jgi:hypothetical protein
MELRVAEHHGINIGIGPEGERLLVRAANSSRLVEACANAGVDRMVLYPENLPEDFFDLSSRVAGEVLNKLRMYQVRLAVVRTPRLKLSSRFGEMLSDEWRYGYFGLFDDLPAALDWLSGA